MQPIHIVLIVALVIGLFIWWQFEKRRRNAWSRWARANGFVYSSSDNRAVASEFQFLRRLDQGNDRIAKDVVRGRLAHSDVIGFNYTSKRQISATGEKGTADYKEHYRDKNLGVVALRLDRACPELTIRSERVWNKLASAVLGSDLDVGSTRFRKQFVLNGSDAGFARAFCNPQMERLLMSTTDLGMEVEVDGYWLALTTRGKLSIDELDELWRVLQEMAAFLPATLIEERKASADW